MASSGGGAATETIPEDVQRWTARRRMALVFCILKGEMSEDECAQRHGLSLAEIGEWKARMLAAAHNALRSRPRAEDATKDEQIRRLQQKVGELVVDVDLLREALEHARSQDDAEASDD
jgi:transposase